MIRARKSAGTMTVGLILGATLLASSTQPVVLAAGPVTVTKVASPEKALRFEVVVPGSLDQVWAAFTTNEGLAAWLWRDVRVDPRPGGDWLAIFPQSTAGGTIISLRPKAQLVIAALAPERFPTVRKEQTHATFEFAALTADSTRVTLVQTGWKTGDEWDAAYEYLADGNAELLTQLYQRFVAGPVVWPKAGRKER
jgi:uncharacterized protein YndB with AHSA1/START domain